MGFSALDLEVQFLGPLPTQPHTPQRLGLIPRKQRNSVDRETTEDEDGPEQVPPRLGGGGGAAAEQGGQAWGQARRAACSEEDLGGAGF